MGKFKTITQNVSTVLFENIHGVFICAGAKKNSMFRFIFPGIEMVLNKNYV